MHRQLAEATLKCANNQMQLELAARGHFQMVTNMKARLNRIE